MLREKEYLGNVFDDETQTTLSIEIFEDIEW